MVQLKLVKIKLEFVIHDVNKFSIIYISELQLIVKYKQKEITYGFPDLFFN